MVPAHHFRQKFPDQEKRRNQIRLDGELHVVGRPFHDGRPPGQAGIVEEDGRMADLGLDAVAYKLDGVGIAQVALVEVQSRARQRRPRQRNVVENDDARARVPGDEFLADACADAAAPPRDNDNLIVPVPPGVDDPVVGALLVELVVESEGETCGGEPVDSRADGCCPVARAPLGQSSKERFPCQAQGQRERCRRSEDPVPYCSGHDVEGEAFTRKHGKGISLLFTSAPQGAMTGTGKDR